MTATEFTIVAAASVVTALTVVTAPLPIVIVILVAGVLLIALYTSLPIWETLLIAAFLAEQYLVDIDIGPASARVYFILAALAGVCARTLVSRRPLFPHADARRFAFTYGVLIAWMLVCQW